MKNDHKFKIVMSITGLVIFSLHSGYSNCIKKKESMNTFTEERKKMEKRIMNLSGNEYWEIFDNPDYKPALDLYVPERKIGIFIDLPQEIDLEKQNDIPLYGIRISDAYVNYHQPFERYGVIVFTNTKLNQVYAGLVMHRKNPTVSIKPKNRSEFREDSFTGIKFKAKIKERLPEVQFVPGVYNCNVITFDQVSNTIKINMINEACKEVVFQTDNPKEILISLSDIEFHSEKKIKSSVNTCFLSIETLKNTFFIKDEKLILSVTYNLSLLKSMVLDDGTLKIYILISGDASVGPELLALRIPLKDIQQSDIGINIKGNLSVNIARYSKLLSEKQRCVFYALVGDTMSLPIVVEIVN